MFLIDSNIDGLNSNVSLLRSLLPKKQLYFCHTVTANYNTITSRVDDQIASQDARANTAMNSAAEFLKNLQNNASILPILIPPLDKVNVDFGVIPVGAIPPVKPTVEIDAIKADMPPVPADFTASVDDRDVQETPGENFGPPTISFPTAPSFAREPIPSISAIEVPIVAIKPTPTIPGDLTVSDQIIPPIPSISLPNFGETIPTISIDLPSANLAYVEPVYTSLLKTELESNLLSKIQNGGTGLNATIEGNIYNRDVERIAQKLSDDIDSTLNRFSGRGFTMPPGTVAAQIQELQINHTNDRSQQSRDVAIQQATIADANTKAFLQMGLSWEQVTLSHANNIANRSLDAEKSVITFGISLFNTKIQKFNAELTRYQAKDIEVQSLFRIETLKLDQYKAELEGVAAEANKDNVSIENYKARLAAHAAQTSLYQAETAAVQSNINIQLGRIELFRANISNYEARAGERKNEYDLYLAEIQGETAKVGLYRSNVDAYAARVSAVKSANETVQEQIRSDIAVEEIKLKAHLANVDIWKEKSQLAIQELVFEKEYYSTQITRFKEAVRMAIANAELKLQADVRAGQFEQAQAKLDFQKALADTNILLDEAKFKLRGAEVLSNHYIALASVAIGAVQTMMQLSSEGIDTKTE